MESRTGFETNVARLSVAEVAKTFGFTKLFVAEVAKTFGCAKLTCIKQKFRHFSLIVPLRSHYSRLSLRGRVGPWRQSGRGVEILGEFRYQ